MNKRMNASDILHDLLYIYTFLRKCICARFLLWGPTIERPLETNDFFWLFHLFEGTLFIIRHVYRVYENEMYNLRHSASLNGENIKTATGSIQMF